MISDPHTVTMNNADDNSEDPDTYRVNIAYLMQEFFAVRTLATADIVAITPALDVMASVIASSLLSHAPDAEKAEELRKQFTLVLSWKIKAIINKEEPDEDGECGGFDAVREAAREVLRGAIITSINERPLI